VRIQFQVKYLYRLCRPDICHLGKLLHCIPCFPMSSWSAYVSTICVGRDGSRRASNTKTPTPMKLTKAAAIQRRGGESMASLRATTIAVSPGASGPSIDPMKRYPAERVSQRIPGHQQNRQRVAQSFDGCIEAMIEVDKGVRRQSLVRSSSRRN